VSVARHRCFLSPDYTLTLNRRTAQRSYGVLDASLAFTSTTRSCAWPGGAGAHSGVTKFLFLTHHLPLSWHYHLPPQAFGSLPIPSTDTSILDSDISDDELSHNISFRCADWVNQRIPEDEAGYDVIVG
jgi:hypothetical protein